jgi:enamine deaminase RidA (YjgF/YER057c/UK114 family)
LRKLLPVLAALSVIGTASADDVTRVPLPAGVNFPIAAAVEIPPGKTLVYVSGTGAAVSDPTKPARSTASYGDTETQTISALTAISNQLGRIGLQIGDVVQMRAYLVADRTKNNTLDFDGFMRGYTRFFGTKAQPKLPARSAFQVAALVNPGWLVEIEVTAVRP